VDKVLIIIAIILAVLLAAAAVWGQNTSNDLAAIQDKLAEAQQGTADAKQEAAIVANRLEEISGKLADTKAILADTQSKLAKTQEELDSTNFELAETRKKSGITGSELPALQSEPDGLSPEGQQTLILRPTGPGSETAIDTQYPVSGAHWEKVDEATTDDDSTFIENKNGEPYTHQRDLFALQNHTTTSGIIDKVAITVRTMNCAPGDVIHVACKTHGAVYDYNLGGGQSVYYYDSHEMQVNPHTEAAWTWEEIDAMEAGISLGGSVYSPDWSRCTQLYVEVYYH